MSETLAHVYTQPGCLPCKRVINKLLEAGVPIEVVDISLHEEAKTYVTQVLGAKSTPVIVSDVMEPILGYQPDKLKELIVTLNADKIHDHVGDEL